MFAEYWPFPKETLMVLGVLFSSYCSVLYWNIGFCGFVR